MKKQLQRIQDGLLESPEPCIFNNDTTDPEGLSRELLAPPVKSHIWRKLLLLLVLAGIGAGIWFAWNRGWLQ